MKTPFPITYRELWQPAHIRGTQLPPFRGDAHALTLTGAQKGTTADEVHFDGTATSNIVVAAAAGQNAQQAFAITIRFKLDTTFAAGAPGDFYLYQKLLAADDYLRVYLKAADGKLYWEQGNGAGGIQFTLTSTTVSWAAGTPNIITVELTSTPTQRLLVNGVVEDTDVAAAKATPNGGDMVIGSSSDGGVNGVVGVISWVVIGVGTTAATALTAGEETDLSKGIPPPTAKVQYMYLMDEGRGVTATDRGSAGGNGTLDTAATWAFGQVRQPCLSLDGINDYAASAAAVDISRDLTIVWVAKMKATYSASSQWHFLINFFRDGSSMINIHFHQPDNVFRVEVVGGGLFSRVDYTGKPAIDDYWIVLLPVVLAGVSKLYINGSLIGTGSGATAIAAGGATAYIGEEQTGIWRDMSKTLFLALIEGALTAAQVKTYSRWLRDVMNLPITI